MGMFDDIICDMPLPDGYNTDRKATFQTKDLDRNLDTLRITSGGRLMLEKKLGEEEPNPRETGYTGTLNFYDIEGQVNDGESHWIWHEYRAQFQDGRCGEIELVKAVTGAELHASRTGETA